MMMIIMMVIPTWLSYLSEVVEINFYYLLVNVPILFPECPKIAGQILICCFANPLFLVG